MVTTWRPRFPNLVHTAHADHYNAFLPLSLKTISLASRCLAGDAGTNAKDTTFTHATDATMGVGDDYFRRAIVSRASLKKQRDVTYKRV